MKNTITKPAFVLASITAFGCGDVVDEPSLAADAEAQIAQLKSENPQSGEYEQRIAAILEANGKTYAPGDAPDMLPVAEPAEADLEAGLSLQSAGSQWYRVKQFSGRVEDSYMQKLSVGPRETISAKAIAKGNEDPFLLLVHEHTPTNGNGSSTLDVLAWNDDAPWPNSSITWSNNTSNTMEVIWVAFAYSPQRRGKIDFEWMQYGQWRTQRDKPLDGVAQFWSNTGQYPGCAGSNSYITTQDPEPTGAWLVNLGFNVSSGQGLWAMSGSGQPVQAVGPHVKNGYPNGQVVFFAHDRPPVDLVAYQLDLASCP